jgi:hypothetical protein
MKVLPMSPAQDARDDVEVSRLLAGAAKVIARVRYCWLVTEAETGGVCARPMGRLLPNPEENDWTIRFVTDGRSGKVGDIRRAGKVGLIFQHDPDDAFVALTGRATLLQRDSEVRRLGGTPSTPIFPPRLTGRTRLSLRLTSSAWSFGSAVSRQSHSDCCRQNLSGVKEVPGVRAIAMRRDPM